MGDKFNKNVQSYLGDVNGHEVATKDVKSDKMEINSNSTSVIISGFLFKRGGLLRNKWLIDSFNTSATYLLMLKASSIIY